MAESTEQKFDIDDLSGGLQRKTSRFLQKDNEVNIAENVDFEEIGGVKKKLGYTQEGTLTSTTSTSTSTSTTSTSTSSSTSSSTSTSTSTTA